MRTKEAHLLRKEATKLSFKVEKDESGKIINPRVVTKVEQAKKDACDINKIIKRAEKTGFIGDPLQKRKTPIFGDFQNVPDYQESLNRVIRMRNEFESLPADVRAKFKNDPANVIDFLADPKNKEEAIKLGLRAKPVITHKTEVTPEGDFVVTYEDGIEIRRKERIMPVPPAPGDPGTGE